MKIKRNPKVIAALLVSGSAVLIAGGALTASWPSTGHRSTVAADVNASVSTSVSPSAQASPVATPTGGVDAESTTQPAPSASTVPLAATSSASATFTYVVKPGDTLSAIAAWFKLHGYGDLYSGNAGVIGSDPNLIRPGERITVTNGVWTMQPPA